MRARAASRAARWLSSWLRANQVPSLGQFLDRASNCCSASVNAARASSQTGELRR
jgi:hypothetical protein